MHFFRYVVLLIILLPNRLPAEVDLAGEAGEMSGGADGPPSQILFVPAEQAIEMREEFARALRVDSMGVIWVGAEPRRDFYARYLDAIGANGILDAIENLWPKCHEQAHDAGKVIFARVRDIGTGLRVCQDRCYSGCMHGVLMEAFQTVLDPKPAGAHVDLSSLKPAADNLCFENKEMLASYSPGDCVHGVGHAFMFLSSYNIPQAIDVCKGFELPAMKYYCATGAYMEYVTERDREDVKGRSLFHPCDVSPYPAACFRYKMVHVARRNWRATKDPAALVPACRALQGKYRLGCFHGLGNAHMRLIAFDHLDIEKLCGAGDRDEQFMCIEGAMERMSKYLHERARRVCSRLEGDRRAFCDVAVDNGMYNMTKDLSLYLTD